jgi:hypothetical protein
MGSQSFFYDRLLVAVSQSAKMKDPNSTFIQLLSFTAA